MNPVAGFFYSEDQPLTRQKLISGCDNSKVMRKDRVILFINIAAHILMYIPLILIFIELLVIVYMVTLHGVTDIVIKTFWGTLIPFIIYIALILMGDQLRSLANNMRRNIETQLVGYLLSTQSPSDVAKISQVLEISQKTVINIFLKVKSEGKLREFIFDSDRKEIIPAAFQSGSPAAVAQGRTSSIADDLLLRAKLVELERLRTEGKISEKAYEELMREIMEGKY